MWSLEEGKERKKKKEPYSTTMGNENERGIAQ